MGSKLDKTLSELLDQGLALPPEQRVVWVDTLGAEHAALKPRLRALLERSVRAVSEHALQTLPSLDKPARPALLRFTRSLHRAGETLGPYRLTHPLGAGAMGTVWCAERSDDGEPSAVAIKFAHMAEQRPDLRLRLEREQHLLGALDHPNIARLYDAGATDEGQPYLVLEYVAGEPLDRYVQAHTPSLRRRLELFLQVAHAVAHAHERQILHRDIKPANVLVDALGSARLLDFGIGKLLSDAAPADLQLSAASGPPLTPAYASPEQLLGQPVGFASDIHALGVLLYELLSGVRPHSPHDRSTRALREAILAKPAVAPSLLATDPATQALLRSSLDAVILKALNKAPEERHASALELAQLVAKSLRDLTAAPA